MAEPMVPEQSYEDVVASVEEARLWDVVTMDFLDFDAWTAFIQETERIAESNILKIRKVNDAFLAGFPLCFGYWKKYADHEGRLDGFNKVFEVYERAVLAVTYSVDVWCNYCQFAISTYNDPDVIRRWRDLCARTEVIKGSIQERGVRGLRSPVMRGLRRLHS